MTDVDLSKTIKKIDKPQQSLQSMPPKLMKKVNNILLHSDAKEMKDNKEVKDDVIKADKSEHADIQNPEQVSNEVVSINTSSLSVFGIIMPKQTLYLIAIIVLITGILWYVTSPPNKQDKQDKQNKNKTEENE